jgi:putative methylase
MRLKQFEIALQRLAGFQNPRAALEQYQTPAPLAARLLYHAFMKGDIAGKKVCDLGSGTGVLAIGAALLGARRVTGIEIDEGAVRTARENASSVRAEVEFIAGDVREPSVADRLDRFDTVVMNPPFGAQNVHADRPFIDLALLLAPVTYGIFNAGSRQFIETYTRAQAEVDEVIGGLLPIRRTFAFHTKDVQEIEVEIIRLLRRRDRPDTGG